MYSKNRFKLYSIILFIFAGLVIASCTPEQSAQPTQNVDAIYTLAALTNEAQQPTQTLLPTVTSTPTATEVPPTAVPARATCTDSAELVSEDPLDNAAFKPGDKITKTWSLKNMGTCVWNNYRFVFDGKEMGGNSNAPVNQIAPGQTITFYAYVAAPLTGATFKGSGTLINSSGNVVKVMYQGGQYNGVSVQIVVKGSATGTVTNESISITQDQSGQACSNATTFSVTLSITTDGPTMVSWGIHLFDGTGQMAGGTFDQAGGPQQMDSTDFNSAGTRSYTYHVTGPYLSTRDSITAELDIGSQTLISNSIVCQ